MLVSHLNVAIYYYSLNFHCFYNIVLLLLSFRGENKVLCVGTTLFECKTGYGLTAEGELKMLRVIEQSRCQIIPDVSVTYCAAHAVPE